MSEKYYEDNMKTLNFLLVWETIGETNVYLIESSEHELEFLKAANGKFINSDECNSSMYCIMYAIEEELTNTGQIPKHHSEDMEQMEINSSWYGKYKNCKLKPLQDLSGLNISTVLTTGLNNDPCSWFVS